MDINPDWLIQMFCSLEHHVNRIERLLRFRAYQTALADGNICVRDGKIAEEFGKLAEELGVPTGGEVSCRCGKCVTAAGKVPKTTVKPLDPGSDGF